VPDIDNDARDLSRMQSQLLARTAAPARTAFGHESLLLGQQRGIESSHPSHPWSEQIPRSALSEFGSRAASEDGRNHAFALHS